MTYRRSLFACLSVVVFSVVGGDRDAAADYVWARTPWGSSNINGHYGSMSNGYGGYYVPRNAVGNNHESQGAFTNPNGYIVPSAPAQVQQYSQPAHTSHFFGNRRRFGRNR